MTTKTHSLISLQFLIKGGNQNFRKYYSLVQLNTTNRQRKRRIIHIMGYHAKKERQNRIQYLYHIGAAISMSVKAIYQMSCKQKIQEKRFLTKQKPRKAGTAQRHTEGSLV
ncbi:hypothetical protein FGO68_gene2596 [Halteria grandinella]|uniref:Uncharacterized protein n=1 Tax=Halteria grandinella TaxID=5974 RepID=A0A8J8SYP3_HALGN|nr:hypothetical protein FGO68_gene2596 [Halteria grandinella]